MVRILTAGEREALGDDGIDSGVESETDMGTRHLKVVLASPVMQYRQSATPSLPS